MFAVQFSGLRRRTIRSPSANRSPIATPQRKATSDLNAFDVIHISSYLLLEALNSAISRNPILPPDTLHCCRRVQSVLPPSVPQHHPRRRCAGMLTVLRTQELSRKVAVPNNDISRPAAPGSTHHIFESQGRPGRTIQAEVAENADLLKRGKTPLRVSFRLPAQSDWCHLNFTFACDRTLL